MAKPSHNLFTVEGGDEEKTYWHKVGVAWPSNNGNGHRLQFNSLPLPNHKGKVVVFMFENKDDRPPAEKPSGWTPSSLNDDMDDDVPF